MNLNSEADFGLEKHGENQLFHVLAVDDSNIDRKVLEKLLTVSSYQVTCVESGDKALEYLGLLDIEENHEYDSSSSTSSLKSSHQDQQVSKVNLIMTDYSMPGITGYDLLKRVKDSSWKDIPVVVMSSENVPSRINMCLEGGAEEFLLKPVQLSDLRKLHSNLLINSNITNSNCDDAIINNNDDFSSTCGTAEMTNDINNNNNTKEETDKNCTNSNKRKAAASSTTSSDLSDRRPRVKELPVA